MKIAVINEFSTANRNEELITVLSRFGHEVFNVGMMSKEDSISLDYVMTGIMTGLSINSGAVDMVVGGCGSGQGFSIASNQFPNVYCSLVLGPLDAWLASQINAPNVLSLALSLFMGNAVDQHLSFILEHFFREKLGGGYPPERAGMQQDFRDELYALNKASHRSVIDILKDIKPATLKTIMSVDRFADLMMNHGQDDEIKGFLKTFM